MTSEHYTYRCAASDFWTAARAALIEFNERYQDVQRLFRGSGAETVEAIEAGDKLLNEFAFRKNGTAPTFSGPFHDWVLHAFFAPVLSNLDRARPSGRMIVEIIDGQREIDEFLTALDSYNDALREVIDDIAPERFTYSGFKILNPDHLGDQVVRKLLEGVDYLEGVFKRRGLEPLLKTGIKRIELLAQPSMKLRSDTASGLYSSSNQAITMSTRILGERGAFTEWVNEVFVHEFGHFVHMNYMPPAAKAAWDSGWDEAKDKKEALNKAFKSISLAERQLFFSALQATNFDASRAAKKLDAIGKVKFGVWLRNPTLGDPLITAKKFRWTKVGDNVASFFTEPEKYMKERYDWMVPGTKEYDDALQRVDRQMRSKLALDWNGTQSVPADTVVELSKADPSMEEAVKEALAKLQIVSAYGHENEREDFAETFLAFVAAPERLTPTAKFRMQRALSLSNFYNKPVMRLAEKASLARQVVDRFLRAQ